MRKGGRLGERRRKERRQEGKKGDWGREEGGGRDKEFGGERTEGKREGGRDGEGGGR